MRFPCRACHIPPVPDRATPCPGLPCAAMRQAFATRGRVPAQETTFHSYAPCPAVWVRFPEGGSVPASFFSCHIWMLRACRCKDAVDGRGAALLDRQGFLNILSTDDNRIIPRLWAKACRAGLPASCSRFGGTPPGPEKARGKGRTQGFRRVRPPPRQPGKGTGSLQGRMPGKGGAEWLRAVGGTPSPLLRRERTYACTPRGNPSSGF